MDNSIQYWHCWIDNNANIDGPWIVRSLYVTAHHETIFPLPYLLSIHSSTKFYNILFVNIFLKLK